jgi:hypothetical protein
LTLDKSAHSATVGSWGFDQTLLQAIAMETVLTGWADISELRFDAKAQTLTIVYLRGETRLMTAVSQTGFDRFVGKPDSSATASTSRLGPAWRVWAVCQASIMRSTGRYFNFGPSIAGGRRQCNYQQWTCLNNGMMPLQKTA